MAVTAVAVLRMRPAAGVRTIDYAIDLLLTFAQALAALVTATNFFTNFAGNRRLLFRLLCAVGDLFANHVIRDAIRNAVRNASRMRPGQSKNWLFPCGSAYRPRGLFREYLYSMSASNTAYKGHCRRVPGLSCQSPIQAAPARQWPHQPDC